MKYTAANPIQIKSGKKYGLTFGGPAFTEECCDCGLVHRVKYTVEMGRLFVQYVVDDRLTASARARRKLDPRQPRRPRKAKRAKNPGDSRHASKTRR